MRRYQGGDHEAFRLLFARFGGPIYRYFLHRTGEAALAKDCAQKTWLNVHKARASFNPGKRMRPWLYTIAVNLRADEARSRTRSHELLTADGTLPEPVSAHQSEWFAAVRQALLALPDIYRDVILLHRWHDLGFAEIAEILGLTESTVKVRAYRGYLQLRKTLLAAKDS